MLDTATLRVCFALVALTLVVLFYLAAFRTTRSSYCGWWCCSLLLFIASSAFYLFDHTPQQVWANPVGNVLAVLGGGSVWAAARSLRAPRPPAWAMVAPAIVVGVASAVDDPAHNDWSGGALFLPALAGLLGLAAVDTWRFRVLALADPGTRRDGPLPGVALAMVLISAGGAVFYAGRSVAFWLVGADRAPFTTVFGSQTTTLVLIVLLSTVSFSMSALSNEQRTVELQDRAMRDGLTGLLNRTEFTRQADKLIRSGSSSGLLGLAGLGGSSGSSGSSGRDADDATDSAGSAASERPGGGALIMADLDHFKRINDSHGHAAGDEVLRVFANACVRAVRVDDLVARYGGEEFVLLLPDAGAARAAEVTTTVSATLAEALPAGDAPTASYGVVLYGAGDDVGSLVAAADAAMYRAKQSGRDRAVLADADA